MGDANRMVEEVHNMLDTVNYNSIKRAISHLKTQGLILRPKHDKLTLSITKLGQDRIANIVPMYRTERPWDGYLYLISYDIPKKSNASRDRLREYIRRTGGALLQESLWMNPYNPTLILEDFVRLRRISGTVLVSKLGKDGAIGNENLDVLLDRIYHLHTLVKRYQTFIDTYKQVKHPSLLSLSLEYFSILKDDPQLPFDLLPNNFPAEHAYQLFEAYGAKGSSLRG